MQEAKAEQTSYSLKTALVFHAMILSSLSYYKSLVVIGITIKSIIFMLNKCKSKKSGWGLLGKLAALPDPLTITAGDMPPPVSAPACEMVITPPPPPPPPPPPGCLRATRKPLEIRPSLQALDYVSMRKRNT